MPQPFEMGTGELNPAQAEDLAYLFSELAARWEDEKGYEDFAGYKEIFKRELPWGYTLQNFTQRPFRAVFARSNIRYSLLVNASQVRLVMQVRGH